MGIFTKAKAVEVVEQPANYHTALDYLIGLSGDDYTKVCQVAAVHRQANHEASKILGVKDQATTFIFEPEYNGVPLSEHKLEYEKLPVVIRKTKKSKKTK